MMVREMTFYPSTYGIFKGPWGCTAIVMSSPYLSAAFGKFVDSLRKDHH
ncbi:hypothetical protein [Oceanobacillus arenosus]|nr:hypothetical protein [Oceanobacillus arenosus]